MSRPLTSGGGIRDPIFERIDRERSQAAEEARRMHMPQLTVEKIEKSRGNVDELRAYYTGEESPRPGLHGAAED